jgi:hypothetical protein
MVGAYTNNPHVLAKYDVTGPEDKYLSLVLSQVKKTNDLCYTLNCYCTEAFDMDKPAPALPACIPLAVTLPADSGRAGTPSFASSPTFAVNVPRTMQIQIKLSVNEGTAVNMMFIPVRQYGDGLKRAAGEPTIDSGHYRHGFVVTKRTTVPAGAYVMSVSKFNRTDSDVACQVEVTTTLPVKLEAIVE